MTIKNTDTKYLNGLNDPDYLKRVYTASLPAVPTPEQYQAGLDDEHEMVRSIWAYRSGPNGITPNQRQIEAGLNDSSEMVKLAWEEIVSPTPIEELGGFAELKFEPDLQSALDAEVERLKREDAEHNDALIFNQAMANIGKSNPELLKGTIMEGMQFVEHK